MDGFTLINKQLHSLFGNTNINDPHIPIGSSFNAEETIPLYFWLLVWFQRLFLFKDNKAQWRERFGQLYVHPFISLVDKLYRLRDNLSIEEEVVLFLESSWF